MDKGPFKKNESIPIKAFASLLGRFTDNNGFDPGISISHETIKQPPFKGTTQIKNAEKDFDLKKRTPNRELEVRFKKDRALLLAFFEGITDPLIMVKNNLKIEMLNRPGREYFKDLDPYLVIGNSFFKEIKERLKKGTGCNQNPKTSCHNPLTFEIESPLNPERIERFEIYFLTIFEDANASAIIRITDVTGSRLMENQFIQTEKMASLGLLMAGITHEISNPSNFITLNLTVLRDYLEALLTIAEGYSNNNKDFELFGMSCTDFRRDIEKLMDNIDHGASRISSMVSELREFASMEDAKKKVWVSLKSVVGKSIDLSNNQLKKKVRTLNVDIPKDLKKIYTNPKSLEQVLINLLINAAHAADKKDPWIKLLVQKLSRGQDELVIEVSDNGSGIDGKSMSRLFDPFFTTKEPGQGLGLGLYVSKNLIEGVHGNIEVESEPGKGTTFRVFLPYKPIKAKS